MLQQANDGLVGIVSGSMDATDLGKATDLAIGLGTERERLRPLLIIGKGALQNVNDVVFARGIDMGIVQSDVLADLKQHPPFPGIENYLRYITRLYDEEVHILAGKDIGSVQELAGKKVNFGMSGTGTHMSAANILRKLGVSVEATNFPQPIALEKLRRGEIAALVCIVSKPDRWFRGIGPNENLHFLPIPATDEFRESYMPTTLRAEEYPALIDPDRPVATLAVGNVLVVYNWPASTERYRNVTRFVSTFFDRLRDLRSPPYHPKWREIDLAAPVPGWTRFAGAQKWFEKARLEPSAPTRNAEKHQDIEQRNGAALTPQDRDALFAEFQAYQKRWAQTSKSPPVFDRGQRELLFAEFLAYQKGQAVGSDRAGRLGSREFNGPFATAAN
jgi:TRAP-type uncharacterized transport system substrate-binding protein